MRGSGGHGPMARNDMANGRASGRKEAVAARRRRAQTRRSAEDLVCWGLGEQRNGRGLMLLKSHDLVFFFFVATKFGREKHEKGKGRSVNLSRKPGSAEVRFGLEGSRLAVGLKVSHVGLGLLVVGLTAREITVRLSIQTFSGSVIVFLVRLLRFRVVWYIFVRFRFTINSFKP